MNRESKATINEKGILVPGDWIKPGIGRSRFTNELRALRLALDISTMYGPYVWDACVVREKSKSRPGKIAFQVYIRSLGAMEGLIKAGSMGDNKPPPQGEP